MIALFRWTVPVAVVLASNSANAHCAINGVRPTGPLPTLARGQHFLFVASDDCERVRFRVPGSDLIKIPKAGPDTGSKDRTYTVELTETEWNSLVADGDTTFTWSIIGRSSTGVTTRVTTTNDVVDQAVTRDLSRADAKLMGQPGDYAGFSVSGAGDVNGDGRDDLLVGAIYHDEGGAGIYAGAAYMVLGPVTGTLDLALADATLLGEGSLDYAGSSVSRAGDVDGDGNDDLLVGAEHNGAYAGAAYLVLGPATGTLDLALADAKLVGAADDWAGIDVSGAGDVDADGHDDLLIGAFASSPGGAAYLVLGPSSGTVDLSLADAKLAGEAASDYAGISVAGAGDVDGDGHVDLLVGAQGNQEGGAAYFPSSAAGAAYLVLGPVTGTLDLSLADAKFVGEASGDAAGRIVSGAGDVDGDGHDDLLVGAIYNSDGGAWAGAAYVVLGPVTGHLDLSLADATLVGEALYDTAGSVSSAGDVNADGRDDILVGAYGNDEGGDYSGAAYLVLGPVTGTVDLAVADAKFDGEEGFDFAGLGVSGAGDVDGDGRDDLLIGAQYNAEGGSGAGAAYLLYGRSL